MSLFDRFRHLATTRWMRVVSVLVFVMCSVTWVAQAVSSVQDGKVVAALTLAAEQAEKAALPEPLPVDCVDDESECEPVPLVALDETHDVKLFFLREFTHLFQPVVTRMPRNRDLAAILRRSSETFRPPDPSIGDTGRPLAS